MTRSFAVTFCFWLVLGFVVWNVLFDRQVALAAVAFTREQTRNRERGLPRVTIDEGFSPGVRAAAVRATLYTSALLAVGAGLTLIVQRRSRRDSEPPPPR
jgi:hypothetical protein